MLETDDAASEALNEKYICVSSAYRWKSKLCCLTVEKYIADIKLDLVPIPEVRHEEDHEKWSGYFLLW